MSTTELTTTLKHIEAAIDVFQRHEGKLAAQEISVKSMLFVIRAQLNDQLLREKSISGGD